MIELEVVLATARTARSQLGGDIYLVGGAVRDILLTRDTDDLDFVVVPGDYERYARLMAKQLRSVAIPFKQNMRIPLCGSFIDVSAPHGETLKDDLAKRDFTINNLAMDLQGEIHGDKTHIEQKIIYPAYNELFDDDPVRILRGFRQANALGFSLSNNFLVLAERKMPLITAVATERITDELKKLTATGRADKDIFEAMNKTALWQTLLEANPSTDVLCNSIKYGHEDNFALFITALASSSATPIRALQKLFPSGQFYKRIRAVLDSVPVFISQLDVDIERAVWDNKSLFPLLPKALRTIYGVKENLIEKCYEIHKKIMDTDRDALITGEYVLSVASETAPELTIGNWVGILLNECNYKLTFGLLADKQAAKKNLREQISLLN
ncbi:hypothetical protein AGMMS49941_05440 [Deferribacterales bacterium]|nr:hypothetical protein AGMMS49941_05440 [Deferribacterales bacterium]